MWLTGILSALVVFSSLRFRKKLALMGRPRTDIQPRIVRAARARFLAEGVDGASLRTIAADAGTSVGMIFYYFPTKDDLFLAVVEEVYARLLDDLRRALSGDAPVRERLKRAFLRLGRRATTSSRWCVWWCARRYFRPSASVASSRECALVTWPCSSRRCRRVFGAARSTGPFRFRCCL